jgi:hypothetical protein
MRLDVRDADISPETKPLGDDDSVEPDSDLKSLIF